eukprot:48120-Eustigmatos_ZCMA.PRE.1
MTGVSASERPPLRHRLPIRYLAAFVALWLNSICQGVCWEHTEVYMSIRVCRTVSAPFVPRETAVSVYCCFGVLAPYRGYTHKKAHVN